MNPQKETYKISLEPSATTGKTNAVLVSCGESGTLRVPANGKPASALNDAIRWIEADIRAKLRVHE